ncbi:MAG: hypothetical protein H0T64_05715 [Pyrinomonadaceae bacterium]|nr:hypothetical protein [Pyrinomonadaceae bacterium]
MVSPSAHHNVNFVAIMDEHLPQWRLNRQELNSAPLANALLTELIKQLSAQSLTAPETRD